MVHFHVLHPYSLIFYLLIEAFPAILRHKAEQGEKGPAKRIEAREAEVGVFTGLVTLVSAWTRASKRKKNSKKERTKVTNIREGKKTIYHMILKGHPAVVKTGLASHFTPDLPGDLFVTSHLLIYNDYFLWLP